MREWSCTVQKEQEGKTLKAVLSGAGFTKKEISRQKFLPQGITVDGKPCRVTQEVKAGQRIVLRLTGRPGVQPEAAEGLLPLKVCYEDPDVLIVDKPSGLSCHPGKGHYRDNLGSQAAAHCRESQEDFVIREIGRLDRDTSGLVVFGKSQAAAARLWKQREDGTFKKQYQAVVWGKMDSPEGILDFPIRKVPGEKNRMETAACGMAAVTHYQVQRELSLGTETASLLLCTLETGRTHQIRVHMAACGHPVLGDVLYGRETADRACIEPAGLRLQLHACRVQLRQPFTGEPIEIRALKKGIPFL